MPLSKGLPDATPPSVKRIHSDTATYEMLFNYLPGINYIFVHKK